MAGTQILDSYCSDHNPLSLSMVIGDNVKGKGYWKFPDFLINDPAYNKYISASISQCAKDNEGADPGLLWDTIKMNIRGSTIDYLVSAKKKRKMSIEKIEQDISRASRMRDAVAKVDPVRCTTYANRVDDL